MYMTNINTNIFGVASTNQKMVKCEYEYLDWYLKIEIQIFVRHCTGDFWGKWALLIHVTHER